MTDLSEDLVDIPPHGRILVLRPRESGSTPRANAIAERLLKYAECQTPFVGILVDLAGVDYEFSSSDVGSVGLAIAAWVRGWVAPCAIVLTGTAADALRKTLDVTQLSSLEQLAVVGTTELGLQHIVRQLERGPPGIGSL
jgi:hypothetical protein